MTSSSSLSSAPEATIITFAVGPQAQPITVPLSVIPSDSFLSALTRQQQNFSNVNTLVLREGHADFVRLLCRFWQESARNSATAFNEYKIALQSFYDSFIPPDVLQRFTFNLCHLYARATKIVGRPAPVYYAHLAAYQAEYFQSNFRGDKGRRCAETRVPVTSL